MKNNVQKEILISVTFEDMKYSFRVPVNNFNFILLMNSLVIWYYTMIPKTLHIIVLCLYIVRPY